MTAGLVKVVADQADMALGTENCLPSNETMPAASWPRCCSACRPSATKDAASALAENPEHAAFIMEAVSLVFSRVEGTALKAGAIRLVIKGSCVSHVVGPFPTGRPE
jgi:hypothetical protein